MKRFVNILFWFVVCAYYFAALAFVSAKRSDLFCKDVRINVLDSVRSRFVTAEYISQMVENKDNVLRGVLFDSINFQNLEHKLNAHPPIRRVNIFKTFDGVVHIDITQRTPIVRIINSFGESFYIDQYGETLKHSRGYSAHVLVATGHINFRLGQENINVLDTDYQTGTRNVLLELFQLANYINEDKFWKAQIQQIEVNRDREFELIPMVGAHVIIFGTFENHEEKFSRLKLFYRNGLSVKGWNTYSKINLKYEGQIVATKR